MLFVDVDAVCCMLKVWEINFEKLYKFSKVSIDRKMTFYATNYMVIAFPIDRKNDILRTKYPLKEIDLCSL
jgi:hypothetical protein